MKKYKYSAGLWVFGAVPDRYLPSGYQKTKSVEERLKALADTPGISGVELPYGPVLNKDTMNSLPGVIKSMGLEISSLGVNVTSNSKWALGSISSPDAEARRDALNIIKESMETAKILGVKTVNLWMGQEGFDYPFECDYNEIWDLMVEGLRICADSCPDVNLSVEYKCMEPRPRNIPNSTAQAVLLVKEAERANLGVTIDFGHAVMGKENPSQSVLLLNRYNKLFHLHINDNYGDWDWDMAAGIDHWWQLVEFCYWMRKIDYDGWLVVDIFPYRHQPDRLTALSIKAMEKAFEIVDNLDNSIIEQGFRNRSALEVYERLLK